MVLGSMYSHSVRMFVSALTANGRFVLDLNSKKSFVPKR